MNYQQFSNQQIDLNTIPTWETVNFVSICPRYKNIVCINTLIVFICAVIGLIIIWKIDKNPVHSSYIITLGGVILFFMVWLILNLFALKRRGYAIREHDILYRSGILTHYTLVIPFKHIQHVKIKETLFGRYFKVSTIEVFTSGSADDMAIRGIDQAKAQILQEYISKKISDWKAHPKLMNSEEYKYGSSSE